MSLKQAFEKQEEEHQGDVARSEGLRQGHNELSGELVKVENEVATLQGLQSDLDERIKRLADQQQQFERQRSELQARSWSPV